MLAEAEPVRAAQDGDPRAQRVLFDRFQPSVMSLCLMSANGDRDRAIDLTQETFTRAFRGISGLSDPTRFRSWLFKIASNVCRTRGADEARRRAAMQAFLLHQDVELGADDAVERERRITTVRRILEQVPDPTVREIVGLKYGEPEHTTRDIAAKLGIPHGTVTVKLMRFRAAIRRDLLRALLEEGEIS